MLTLNYDRDNLICYKHYWSEMDSIQSCHLIISKQDGRIIREIQTPVKEIQTLSVTMGEGVSTPVFYPTISDHDNWILMNPSSDTLYTCLPDGTISPFIVRTPSIHSMNPEIFLFLSAISERYYFMHTVKKEFDFETMKGFPNTDLFYDKHEKAIFKCTIYNNDFSDNREVFLKSRPVNHEIATSQSLDAYILIEAYKEGQLKGKLKEIAAELDEESLSYLSISKMQQTSVKKLLIPFFNYFYYLCCRNY
ncbi:hypothetical protein FACS189411_11410 [Bacteroidia bacterium]|nr:hypothetical protein FACS189411_11410 [Bacteroidia bacterium]